MIVTCAKCGIKIAEVKPPSTVKKGASISGVCYDCKMKERYTDDDAKAFFRGLGEINKNEEKPSARYDMPDFMRGLFK